MTHNELYHVPLIWRLIGLLCIGGIIAAVVLIGAVGRAEADFGQPVIPLGAHIEYAGDGAGERWPMAVIDGKMMIVTEEQIAVSRQLQYASSAAVGAILCFAIAAELCLIPSLTWKLQTLVVRIWSYSDPEPSDGWFIWLRIRIGLAAAIGCGVLIGGFLLLP